jgi:hypothetical protein
VKIVIPKLAKIKVGQESLDLDYLLNTDFDDVREASEKIPAAIAWLGWQRAYAYEWLTVAEQVWNEAEAEAYFDLKHGGFIEKGYGDKMTEEALKKAVFLDPKVHKAAVDYGSAKRWLEVYDSGIKSLLAKLDLVRTSEATRRRLTEPLADELARLERTATTTSKEQE